MAKRHHQWCKSAGTLRAELAEDAWAHGLRLTYTLAKPGVQTHGLARRKLVSHRLGQKVSNGAKTGPLLCRLVGLENAAYWMRHGLCLMEKSHGVR